MNKCERDTEDFSKRCWCCGKYLASNYKGGRENNSVRSDPNWLCGPCWTEWYYASPREKPDDEGDLRHWRFKNWK